MSTSSRLASAKYDFSGKIALVTGSSSGIGQAIAIQLARSGAQLTITGRDGKRLEAVSKEIETISGNVPLQLIGDLLDEAFVAQLVVKTIEKYGRLDILVNNAGGGTANEIFSNPNLLSQYDKVFGLNVRAPLQLIHCSVPFLKQSKGSIVNISSVASITPTAMCVYSCAKAALDMLTKTSAGQLASKGIRVNGINPGPVYTRGGRIYGNENHFYDHQEAIEKKTALKRIAQPGEIANLAIFLLSEDARNMTGSSVICDGGKLVNMN